MIRTKVIFAIVILSACTDRGIDMYTYDEVKPSGTFRERCIGKEIYSEEVLSKEPTSMDRKNRKCLEGEELLDYAFSDLREELQVSEEDRQILYDYILLNSLSAQGDEKARGNQRVYDNYLIVKYGSKKGSEVLRTFHEKIAVRAGVEIRR